MEKFYIVFHTCGSSRAIHLYVVPDLSTKTFITSFTRFIRRRGIPRLSCQKTPKTLETAAKFLSFLFELPEVRSFSLNHKIKWRFNLELAPWRGGVFDSNAC